MVKTVALCLGKNLIRQRATLSAIKDSHNQFGLTR